MNDYGGDRIEIRGLEVLAFCGVLDEEQARQQPFRVEIDIHTDLTAAGQSDDLVDTVDYGAVTDRIVERVGGQRFQLVERMAQWIGDIVFEFSGADAATVTVTKLRPPVAANLATTGVRIHRHRPVDADR